MEWPSFLLDSFHFKVVFDSICSSLLQFRSIHHKLDVISLRIYRFYHSFPTQLALGTVIATLHLLAIFEHPSSLTWTSDIRRASRVAVPCWVTQVVEILCLLLLLLDVTCKVRAVLIPCAWSCLENIWSISERLGIFVDVLLTSTSAIKCLR